MQPACCRQKAISAVLKRVFTGIVTAPDAERVHRARGAARSQVKILVREAFLLGHQRVGLAALARLALEHLSERLLPPAHRLPIQSPEASCSSIASISASRA